MEKQLDRTLRSQRCSQAVDSLPWGRLPLLGQCPFSSIIQQQQEEEAAELGLSRPDAKERPTLIMRTRVTAAVG